MIFADPGVGCSSYYGYRIANVVCVWQKNQYVDKMQQRCNDNEKKCKKISKKWLTFPWGFVIIILALSDRAKLIKSH